MALSLVDKSSSGITNSYVSHITTGERRDNLGNYLILLCEDISISLFILVILFKGFKLFHMKINFNNLTESSVAAAAASLHVVIFPTFPSSAAPW